MNKNFLRIFIQIAVIAILLFIANLLIYKIPQLEGVSDGFIYYIGVIYLFFFIFSAIILAILVKISNKNREQLGYAFLLMTSIKMVASYFLARPVIAASENNPTEKINFFIIFVLFLAIEAYYTARLLNNK